MRHIQFKPNKKAVSLIISYVLLISIGLSIAGLVYGWLKFYANIGDTPKCPDGIHLAIMSAPYFEGKVDGSELNLNLTIENRGRFSVAGYVIRASNKTDAKIGTFTIYDSRPGSGVGASSTDAKFPPAPGNASIHYFNATHLKEYGKICFIEVQPFIIENDNIIACTQISTKKIDC
jgi:hypothetical protein